MRDTVDFGAPNVRNLIEGERHQVLVGCTNKKVHKLNRHAVIFMGSQIDVVDHIRSIAYETMLQSNMFVFGSDSDIQNKLKQDTSLESNATPQVRWKTVCTRHASPEVDLMKCQVVVDHIDYCMQKFTTYFMIGHHISKGDNGKAIDTCSVVGAAIIKKMCK